jgi:hypothetical protein
MSGSLNGNSASSGGATGAGGDDFFDQMLSSLPSTWADLAAPKSPWDMSAATNPNGSGEDCGGYDESALLASQLRQHQISGSGSPAGVKPMMLHQMLMSSAGRAPGGAAGGGRGAGDPSGFFPLPLSLGRDDVEGAFKSPNGTVRKDLYIFNFDLVHILLNYIYHNNQFYKLYMKLVSLFKCLTVYLMHEINGVSIKMVHIYLDLLCSKHRWSKFEIDYKF